MGSFQLFKLSRKIC